MILKGMDYFIIGVIPLILIIHYGLNAFQFWHLMILAFAFGMYFANAFIHRLQAYNAKRIGMEYELEKINRWGKNANSH